MQDERKWVYACTVTQLQDGAGEPAPGPSPLSLRELYELGIPARKARRVQRELAALAARDAALRSPAVLGALARQIARQLP